MTTIKMNDGRTEYDVEESYGDISESLLEEFIPGNDFIVVTDTQYGEMLLNKNNILSVKESREREYEK